MVESGRLSVEEIQDVFDLIEYVQTGLAQILGAGEGDDAIEGHFAGFAFEMTSLRDSLLEHIPELVREKN